ncbi:HlyD family type I secretion periplasmic adaptor subunit, partial [Tianweitania sp.]|uniref:HlyD family type I secretion periplasmic adaptor subunit n=1 Tax=Tianweitania sp. TaxID=2021634 RepID=UPI00289FF071
AQANGRQLYLRRARLEALVARLRAQGHRAPSVTWPDLVRGDDADAEIGEIVETQRLNFEAWTSKLNSDVGLLEQNIASLDFRSRGYDLQRSAMEKQLALLNEEFEGKQVLLKQGLMRATEIKSIQRAIADSEGQIGRLVAEISETGAQVVKSRQQIEQVSNTYVQAALDELQKAQSELDSIREQSREADSVLRRSTIDAPVAGTIIRLYYHTSGGVIESGKAILEILPSDVPLIIETQVPRNQIDNLKVGQHATVRLVALSARTTPVLNGEVVYVSADSLSSTPNGAKEVYLARVTLSPDEIARVHGFHPTPGMPAEILIQTAERTFFDYLTKPVRDSMARAFMER